MNRTDVVLGNEAALAALRELLHEAEHGSLNCVVLRIYRSGGDWEDLVLGGTQEEQARALADLRATRG